MQLLSRHGLTGLELLNLSLQLPLLHQLSIFLLDFHETPCFLIEDPLLLISFNGRQVCYLLLERCLGVDVLLRVAGKLVGFEALRLVPQRVFLVVEGVVFYLNAVVMQTAVSLSARIILSERVLRNFHRSIMLCHESIAALTGTTGERLSQCLKVGLTLARRLLDFVVATAHANYGTID